VAAGSLAKKETGYYNYTMSKNNLEYKQYAAFINRENELKELRKYIDKEPSEILFLHGPKSSGKTTLLYKFIEQIEKEQKLDVKFLNLRKRLIQNYKDFLTIFFGMDYSKSKEDVKEKREYDLKFFKLSVEVLKGMETGELDPFVIMETEFLKQRKRGTKPVVIIDELQAIDHIYMTDGNERQLIIELFNFFVSMTKESHLAHVIIASSDGYFLNTVYTDSKLKKSSEFYKVDYLSKEDVMEWLLNLEKYSKIKDYTITPEDAEKIWDTVGGSMWEIQYILTGLFDHPIDEVLTLYKEKMRSIIAHDTEFDKNKQLVLKVVNDKKIVRSTDLENLSIKALELKELLRDMVRNNILYFDPTKAIYYPQGKSYQWGIQLYFEGT
jgi:AAA+ ATPase superfamily predicted ATPase